MKLSLRQQFLWMFLIIFGVGSGVGYRIFLWYNDDIVSLLGHRLVERNALYQKGQLLSVLSPEVTLARKMASSPRAEGLGSARVRSGPAHPGHGGAE